MNKVILMGRLTRDPELRSTQNNTNLCQFTVAVDRRFKNANGERQVDFINCTAWRQTADFIARYFTKGARIAVVGSIQTSSWDDNDGKKQYKTEVVVDEAYFADSKSSGEGQSSNYGERGSYQSQGSAPASAKPRSGGYSDEFVPAPDDTVLPFDV